MSDKDYSYDIVMQGIARVFGGVLAFVAIYLLTYVFTEAEIGEYNLVLSAINIITSISTLWISQSVLRHYSKQDLGSIISLGMICAIISLASYVVYVCVMRVTFSASVFCYIIVLIFYNIFDAVFRKERKLKSYVYLELLHSLGRLFPMLIIAHYTKNYDSIFLSQTTVLGLFFLVEIYKNKSALKQASYKFSIGQLKQYLNYGMPLVGLSISNWFLSTSDRYIIKFLGDSSQVGIYSTNYSLANSIYAMFALILVNAMHPIIMTKWEENKGLAVDLVSQIIDKYIILMSPLVFYGCLKSEFLLGLFKGNIYVSYKEIFVWTAIGVFFHGLSLLFHKYFECIQKTQVILLVNMLAAIFNIILNFCMIPKFGFEVAAFTTFASYAVYIVVIRILTWKEFKVKVTWSNIAKITLSIVVFYLFDRFLINVRSLLGVTAEGIIYVIYTLTFFQITRVADVKELAKSLIKKFKRKARI